jgi:regulator of ribonuclease activity A
MTTPTTDLCDAHGDAVEVLGPMFADYGGRRRFQGPATTVSCFEDNSLVRDTLETPGCGGVLVVDGGGSMRCALLGDNLGEMAVANGWAAILVYGCVRDSAALAALDLGVRALNTHPRKSVKQRAGDRNTAVTVAGVTIEPGNWLYADEDGIICSGQRLE